MKTTPIQRHFSSFHAQPLLLKRPPCRSPPAPPHCSHLGAQPGQPWSRAHFLEASSSMHRSPHDTPGLAEIPAVAMALALFDAGRDALRSLHPAPLAAPLAPALHRQSCQRAQGLHGWTRPGKGAELWARPVGTPVTLGASGGCAGVADAGSSNLGWDASPRFSTHGATLAQENHCPFIKRFVSSIQISG